MGVSCGWSSPTWATAAQQAQVRSTPLAEILALTGLLHTSHAFNASYSKFVCPHPICAQQSAPLLCLLSDCVCKIALGPACAQSVQWSCLEPDITGFGRLHTHGLMTLQLGRCQQHEHQTVDCCAKICESQPCCISAGSQLGCGTGLFK